MRIRFSLFTRILLWSLVNLVVIVGVLTLLLNLRFHPGPGSLLTGDGGNRLRGVTMLVAKDLWENSQDRWGSILSRFSEAYKVDFALFTLEGRPVAGRFAVLPPNVQAEVKVRADQTPQFIGPPHPEGGGRPQAGPDREPPNGRPSPPPAPGRPGEPPPAPRGTGGAPPGGPQGPEPPRNGPGFGARPPETENPTESVPSGPDRFMFMLQSSNPSYYWAGVILPIPRSAEFPRGLIAFLIRSTSSTGNGLFPESFPWGTILALVLTLSALLWFPLVRNTTRPLRCMTEATERIALGRFDVRLDERRTDEIGRLGKAINEMSTRLDGYVKGQRRFLSDVAHELASPLARIQVGLSILENRIGPTESERLEDVQEDVQHLTELVNELLAFARAEANVSKVRLGEIEVEPLLRRVVDRECPEEIAVHIELEAALRVLAAPELLSRALANLLRNAIRYAGDAGPLEVSGSRDGREIVLRVSDHGPGAPAECLGQLFDPFYRPEPSRETGSGGVGLGLAIVRTCVTACGGTVSCQNRETGGFEVTLRLKAPAEPGR